ncbi:hypothetical protein BJF82_16170 [Kytococcus sp. CUA-901]|nr:hypothetical protein BJF82_16170 [Kytococcus sp. CUA-901]
MRPGGWLLVAAAADEGSPSVPPDLPVAVSRWRLHRAGRCVHGITRVRQELEEIGMAVVFQGEVTPADPPLVLAQKRQGDGSEEAAG